MSFLPTRRSVLDRPPDFPVKAPAVEEEEEKTEKTEKTEQKVARPAIMRLMGATPWFEGSSRDMVRSPDTDGEVARITEEAKAGPEEGESWSRASSPAPISAPATAPIVPSQPAQQVQQVQQERSEAATRAPAKLEEPEEPSQISEILTRTLSDAETQTELSLGGLATLEAELAALKAEKLEWQAKVLRAHEKKLQAKAAAAKEAEAGSRKRPIPVPRPFVSSLGDFEHNDFNVVLLGLKKEI